MAHIPPVPEILQSNLNIDYIAKTTNANTIAHFVPEKSKRLNNCLESIHRDFPNAELHVTKVAIVSVIGSNMKIPGFLARAANALSAAGVNVLAIDQTIRQVNIQFVIEREQFECAQKALHREFVERQA